MLTNSLKPTLVLSVVRHITLLSVLTWTGKLLRVSGWMTPHGNKASLENGWMGRMDGWRDVCEDIDSIIFS